MYRGSSFLLQNDYKIHEEAVKEIIKSDYDSLVAIKFNEIEGENLEKIEKLNSFLRNHYRKVSQKNEDEKISDILITKILLGTLGCVPAYDQYFTKGLGLVSSISLVCLVCILKIPKNYINIFE